MMMCRKMMLCCREVVLIISVVYSFYSVYIWDLPLWLNFCYGHLVFYQGMFWSRRLRSFVVVEKVVVEFFSMSVARDAVGVCLREVICREIFFGCD